MFVDQPPPSDDVRRQPDIGAGQGQQPFPRVRLLLGHPTGLPVQFIQRLGVELQDKVVQIAEKEIKGCRPCSCMAAANRRAVRAEIPSRARFARRP